MSAIRDFRRSTQASQAEFAEQLGVSPESYRMWDSGRRDPPQAVLTKAQALADSRSEGSLGLKELARVLDVSVYRLREAARDGRLVVTYENRAVFGNLVPYATQAAGWAYKRLYYGKRARWTPRPTPQIAFSSVPPDYDRRIARLRARFRISQAQLAERVGAASKAVVYQWESRKRAPSRLFWHKLVALEEGK